MDAQAAEIISSYAGEIHKNYSGRGMYGDKTTGVTFDSQSDFHSAIGEIMEHADEEDRQTVGKALQNLRSDSLGRGIIYY